MIEFSIDGADRAPQADKFGDDLGNLREWVGYLNELKAHHGDCLELSITKAGTLRARLAL